MKSPVYVVDAMNYIFRAYHGLPQDIRSPSGMLTNAVLGYLRTLLRIIRERKPAYLVSAFEKRELSFRKTIFPDYKANRPAPPAELEAQFDYCRRISQAIGVTCFEADDFEADDVIGTVAQKMSSFGHPVVIVTGDKDMLQLVRNDIRVYDIAHETWFDGAAVFDKFGVQPQQIPDMLALLGDSVDNIPGIPGVGPKTARQILSVCTCVEDLNASKEFDPRFSFRAKAEILRRIRDNMEAFRISLQLATIRCDVPLDATPETVRYRRANHHELSALCRELGFEQIIADIPVAQPTLF